MDSPLEIFDHQTSVGILKGFSPLPQQLEVEVIMPANEQVYPRFGEFLLLEIGPTSALVGRVSRFQAAGQLMTEQGERYLADLAGTDQQMPISVVRQLLRYTLKMQLLGKLSIDSRNRLVFSVGEREFASVGSRIRRPSAKALDFLCNVGLENDETAAPLGNLVYGQDELPGVSIGFSVNRLKGRRTFVFARAGYGKSNLIKYLVSKLYSAPPDVGLLIIDPEGEYAFPDTHGRPGLVNVPGFEKRLSVYTNRKPGSEYRSFHRGDTLVDFGDFLPQYIIAGFVPPEKHDMVSMNLLRGIEWEDWRLLIDLLADKGYQAPDSAITSLLSYTEKRTDNVVIGAIKNNLVPAIKRVHRSGSKLSKNIIEELRQNRVVIVDTSLLPGEDSLAVTGLLLRRVFSNNVRHFTDPTGQTVRCLAVLEEAQTMLGDRNLDDRDIFVRWVKEGRKFGLGCILVTQQPGSLSHQIISQGDNFFVLHLLNENDLQILQRHNAHYTDDILGFIRNEPIPGNCYFWSAPNQPYVLPVRVASFESIACRKETRPGVEIKTERDEVEVTEFISRLVGEALSSSPRVWLYRVGRLFGKSEQSLITFSVDYLRSAVSNLTERGKVPPALQANRERLAESVFAAVDRKLEKLGGRFGYAVLQGATRPVCVLPENAVQLSDQKRLRAEIVDVDEAL
jgi:uncharacterized protein